MRRSRRTPPTPTATTIPKRNSPTTVDAQSLLERGAPLEAKNSYGATPLGQALWSALRADGRIDYFQVIDTLLKAGAKIEPATLAWLSQQKPVSPVNDRIAAILKRHGRNE
jgi:hypothetical protein